MNKPGSIAYCGSLIQWLRDNLGIIKTHAESEALASKARPSVHLPAGWGGLRAVTRFFHVLHR